MVPKSFSKFLPISVQLINRFPIQKLEPIIDDNKHKRININKQLSVQNRDQREIV